MKAIVGVYKAVGGGAKGFMGAKAYANISYLICIIVAHSLREPILLYGRHQGRSSTTNPRWSHTFQVREALLRFNNIIDEIKWQVRMPSRYAIRELKLSYLDKVQTEATAFLNQRIKYDFLKPDRELTLDLTIKEAEILIMANEEVQGLAESGKL